MMPKSGGMITEKRGMSERTALTDAAGGISFNPENPGSDIHRWVILCFCLPSPFTVYI
jgi:hypothetical protein